MLRLLLVLRRLRQHVLQLLGGARQKVRQQRCQRWRGCRSARQRQHGLCCRGREQRASSGRGGAGRGGRQEGLRGRVNDARQGSVAKGCRGKVGGHDARRALKGRAGLQDALVLGQQGSCSGRRRGGAMLLLLLLLLLLHGGKRQPPGALPPVLLLHVLLQQVLAERRLRQGSQ